MAEASFQDNDFPALGGDLPPVVKKGAGRGRGNFGRPEEDDGTVQFTNFCHKL